MMKHRVLRRTLVAMPITRLINEMKNRAIDQLRNIGAEALLTPPAQAKERHIKIGAVTKVLNRAPAQDFFFGGSR